MNLHCEIAESAVHLECAPVQRGCNKNKKKQYTLAKKEVLPRFDLRNYQLRV